MSPQTYIPLSSMSLADLFANLNSLHELHGLPLMPRNAKRDRCELATKIALLRATKPPPAPPKPGKKVRPKSKGRAAPVRDTITRLLAAVNVVTKKGTIGHSYAFVLKEVRKAHPESRIDIPGVRRVAASMRKGEAGFTRYKLPDFREREPLEAKKGK